MKHFQDALLSADEKFQKVIDSLEPHFKQGGIEAASEHTPKLRKRYGERIVDEAFLELCLKYGVVRFITQAPNGSCRLSTVHEMHRADMN